jgi:HAMP domain-containing protein
MTARTGRRRPRSVRARTALVAVAVVGAALVVAGLVLLRTLSVTLTSGVDASARLRVEAVANIVAGGTVPTVLAVPGDDSVVVQVIDGSGRVLAASDNVADERPFVTIHPTPTATTVRMMTVRGLPVGEQGEFRVTWRSVDTPRGPWTVVAAASLDPARHTVATLGTAVAASVPFLLALVGLTAWLLAGRALAPVEAIRSQVAEISGRALHRRVPDPGGRDEVGRPARTMNDMLQRLEESQAGQRRFVRHAQQQAYERWDGKGSPAQLRGEQIAPIMRIVHVANDVEALHRIGGVDAAVEMLRSRRGSEFDPRLVNLFCDHAGELLDSIYEIDGWDTVIGGQATSNRNSGTTSSTRRWRLSQTTPMSSRRLPSATREVWPAWRRRGRGTSGLVVRAVATSRRSRSRIGTRAAARNPRPPHRSLQLRGGDRRGVAR